MAGTARAIRVNGSWEAVAWDDTGVDVPRAYARSTFVITILAVGQNPHINLYHLELRNNNTEWERTEQASQASLLYPSFPGCVPV